MSTIAKTKSAVIRERLNHPVIDGDGHFVEILPILWEYARGIGGLKTFEKIVADSKRFLNYDGYGVNELAPKGWYESSPQERRDNHMIRPSFWIIPTGSALERATVTIPNLFRQRLDELGIDFAILYGTACFLFVRHQDDEVRRVFCRAFNMMCADLYRPHAARIAPAAIIPMRTPQEAIEELEFAVTKLGMKVAVFDTCIKRPIAAVARAKPELAAHASWMDVIGHDSEYDYDPVWQKCMELKVAVTSHSASMGWGARGSRTNFVYNHIGHFAAAGEAFCKALVIGGVVQRFPALKFAFLEGGVGWACSLYNDLIEHWEKRNINALSKNLDPARLDLAAMAELFAKYDGKLVDVVVPSLARSPRPELASEVDDFSALKIDNARQFADIFKNFYFGCEPDDRMASVAFNSKLNHYEAKLHAFFSSDVGHFDVPDITAVVSEAYELVEDGLVSEEDFKAFTFTNQVELHASMNPDFFKGTAVEAATKEAMSHDGSP